MIVIPLVPFIPKRKRAVPVPPAPPPVPGLVLQLAAFDVLAFVQLTLRFDREIDITNLHGAQITIADGAITGKTYTATGAKTLYNPMTVRIVLEEVGLIVGETTTMTATSGTGIVATDDGGIWDGATSLELPYEA